MRNILRWTFDAGGYRKLDARSATQAVAKEEGL